MAVEVVSPVVIAPRGSRICVTGGVCTSWSGTPAASASVIAVISPGSGVLPGRWPFGRRGIWATSGTSVNCGRGFCGEVPCPPVRSSHGGGREGWAVRPLAGTASLAAKERWSGRHRRHASTSRSRVADFKRPAPPMLGTGTSAEAVAARFVDAGGEAGRLAQVRQHDSRHRQRVEYLSGTCSSAPQMHVPHPVMAGEIMNVCRKLWGVIDSAAGMPAMRARRWIAS